MIERKIRITRDMFPTSRTERRFFNGNVLLITQYPNTEGKVLFTVIASKKSLKLAVERNQFKRWVYEAIQERMNDFQLSWTGKFVFSLKKGATKPSFQQVKEDINTLLNQKNT